MSCLVVVGDAPRSTCRAPLQLQSRFDVKSIAGNIIPAIAASNAMVAGFQVRQRRRERVHLESPGTPHARTQVLEAMKLLRGDNVCSSGRITFLTSEPNDSGMVFISGTVGEPNPKCVIWRVWRPSGPHACAHARLQVHGMRCQARVRYH